jgi:uncharacterized protein YqcC (DUF446 family)
METLQTLEQLLSDIENELRSLDLWEEVPPPAESLMSAVPFCYDTLQFPQWLQWIFIPRCTQIVRNQASMPASSDILPIAEVYLQEMEVDAPELLVHIERFDKMITQWNDPEGSSH